jgi:hypothetical protein
MKTIFDKATRDELVGRINALSKNSTAQWGKMNVYQMAKHCSLWDEWVLGKNNPTYKRNFIGLIFGRLALKANVKDDAPLRKSTPTTADMIVKEKDGDLELQKKIWTAQIAEYTHYSNPAFVHDFFGRMTVEQIGIFAYKHADHHLRQFGA